MQKSVLVTGCSSGIGLESALDLKRQGFNVLAACRKTEDVTDLQRVTLRSAREMRVHPRRDRIGARRVGVGHHEPDH